jgi:transporter family protein
MGSEASSLWILWAILSAVFAAFTAIFAKIGIQDIDSDLATLIRTAFIMIIITLFVWFTGKWRNPFELTARTWLFLCLSAITTGASWICYFRALKIGDASKVAPIDKFSVVLVAIFAVILLGEKPSLKEWLGIAMVSGGVITLALAR